MTDLVKMHMANLTIIAGLTGHSKTDRTQIKALAVAYHVARLGKREDVEQVVTAIEEQAERIRGMGGAFAPSCIKYLNEAKAAVLKNHEDLPGEADRQTRGDKVVDFADIRHGNNDGPRDDGRPVLG